MISFINKTKYKHTAPCFSSPCKNSGTCNAYNNATSPFYSCTCANGYSGQTCQTCIILIFSIKILVNISLLSALALALSIVSVRVSISHRFFYIKTCFGPNNFCSIFSLLGLAKMVPNNLRRVFSKIL